MVGGTLDWESGAHPQWSPRSSDCETLSSRPGPRRPFFLAYPCIHQFCFLWPSPPPLSPFLIHPCVPVTQQHSLPGIRLSALCSLSSARQTSTPMSSSKSHLLFQEAFPDRSSHTYSLLFCTLAEQCSHLSHTLRKALKIMAQHLPITYDVLRSILNTSQRLSYLILTATP